MEEEEEEEEEKEISIACGFLSLLFFSPNSLYLSSFLALSYL